MAEVMSTDQRAALLDAALVVLQRDGAAALTVRNITREAGCSTSGIYTWFGGKQGLVEAIYLDGFASFDRAIEQATDLLDGCRAYRRWALANPTHYLVMFGRAVPDFVPSPAARARGLRSFEDLVGNVAAAGIPEPRAAAYHLYATIHGYVMLELVGAGPAHQVDAAYESGVRRTLASLAVAT